METGRAPAEKASTESRVATRERREAPRKSGALVSLARLGAESGGTLTTRTNSPDLALEKALERLACTYSLGFEDDRPREGRIRTVQVRVKRRGLRTVHAVAYSLRSDQEKRESVLRAAYLSPSLFGGGDVHAGLLPLRPLSSSVWSGLLAVRFRLPQGEMPRGPREAEFGVVVQRGATVVHRVQRSIRLEPLREGPSSLPFVTFLEPMELPPGAYTLSVVLSDPAEPSPRSVRVEADVPEVPRGGAFLVGPILGRRADADIVVLGGEAGHGSETVADATGDAVGGAASFQPLLETTLDEVTDVVALTQVCVTHEAETAPEAVVGRVLRDSSGAIVGELEPVRATFDASGEVRCRSLVDILPAGAFHGGGSYSFEAILDAGTPKESHRAARLAVGGGPGAPTGTP